MRTLKLASALCLASFAAFGQTGLATVTGTVTDSSGAVVSNAPIEIRNKDNGQILRSATSDTGNFTVSQVPVGDYDLSITVPGFKTYNRNGFHLSAQQTMREDVALQVGQAAESVTVTAEASLLKTESSELVNNVTLAQLNNLPILAVGSTNSGFRDPFASVRLVPGVSYNNGSNSASGTASAVTTMVVNGTPANTYQTRLDGMTMNPTSPRLLGAQMQTQPSTDAIQEVAIQTSNFAAEYGTAGGAMISMVTKSGTNDFHGSVYDYGTNEFFNARQPYTALKGKIRQTDWGMTFGGPLRIPKVYDGRNKTFFFFSFEQFRQKNLLVGNSTVPAAPYRGGDFGNLLSAENRLITIAAPGGNSANCPNNSAATVAGNCNYLDPLGRTVASGTIFDPASQRTVNGIQVRDPFAGNRIPTSRFDPISAKVLALIPQPKGVNHDRGLFTDNFTDFFDSSRRSNIPSIKLDQVIGSKGRLSFYLQETNTKVNRTPTGADPLPDTISASASSFSSGTTVRLNYDHTVSSRLIAHVGAGWNDSDFGLEAKNFTYDAAQALGLVGQAEARYFPRLVSAVNTNTQIGGLSTLGSTFPTQSFERRPSANVSASYVTGAHTIKVGSDWRLEKFPIYPRSGGAGNAASNTTGTYVFGPNYTEQPSLQGVQTNQGFDGFELASFLLGGTSQNSQVAPISTSNSKTQFAIFAQDTWKATRKLTLDYGVRWDYGTYAREQYGRNASIGLAIPNPAASGRLGANQFEAVCNCSFASNYPYAIGPRLGLAYQIDPKTVLRAGWGLVYNATSTASGAAAARADSSALPGNSGQITGLFQNGMPTNVRAVWPNFDPAAGQGAGSVIAMPAMLDQNAGRPGRLNQWNISLQREINRNLVVEGSYVGNRGVWWTASGLATLNTLSEDTLRRYGFTNFTDPNEALLLTRTISTLTTAQQGTLAARGVNLRPYANFPTSQTVRQALLDYPQFTGSGLSGSPLGNTWYDAFQLNVTKRFSHGFVFNLNYNYSKNLDTISQISDVFNRGLSKNISTNDIPHQFRFTAQYQVPDMKNSFIPGTSNRIVAAVLSDWGIGTYLSYQSAPALARPTSAGSLPISQFLGRGPGGAQLKKNADGSYMSPWSVDWVDNSGTRRTDPIDINCHCFDPTKTVVFNRNAWEDVPNGQWGADQSVLRNYRGVRVPNENMNFSRNFKIAREGRITLNVRVEFNNIFNRTILVTPRGGGVTAGNTLNFAQAPTLTTSGANTGLYSGGFGTFNVLGGIGGQRTGTYVARLTF